MFLEASLTAIAVVASFAWPRLFALGFSRILPDGDCRGRRHLAVLVVGLSALVLRIVILPWFPSRFHLYRMISAFSWVRTLLLMDT